VGRVNSERLILAYPDWRRARATETFVLAPTDVFGFWLRSCDVVATRHAARVNSSGAVEAEWT
jgi:hypothetical protein